MHGVGPCGMCGVRKVDAGCVRSLEVFVCVRERDAQCGTIWDVWCVKGRCGLCEQLRGVCVCERERCTVWDHVGCVVCER